MATNSHACGSARDPIVPCRYAPLCGKLCRNAHDEPLDPEIFVEMDCVLRQRRRDLARFLIVALLLTAAAFSIAYLWSERRGLTALNTAATAELQEVVARLDSEIGRYGRLPLTIASDQGVTAFLASPDRGDAAQDTMGAYLARLNTVAGVGETYLIDPDGIVAASSNWREPTSFVNRDISYRPYFQNAEPGKVDRYYGIGTTGNAPGYYLATAVEVNGTRLGVVAVKIDLGALENDWLTDKGQLVLLHDENGVIVLSSQAALRYRTLGALKPERVAEINSTQQYNRHILAPLVWKPGPVIADGTRLVDVGWEGGVRTYLAASHAMPTIDMTLTVLSDFSRVRVQAIERATIVAALVLLACLIVRALKQHQLAIRERLLARDALQGAYGRLKQDFEERSRQLILANADLSREVGERAKAVAQMQSFQEELIRTENLAVIGQLSAGLAHEINQPLAALSTLSENAMRFLELSDTATVQHNLQRICDLVQRMGVLTGQLRSFARRTDDEVGPVELGQSIESAVALLDHRVRKEKVTVVIHRSETPIKARGDIVRVEQVLVNLVSNAMDALLGHGEPRIDITAQVLDGVACIDVEDNGHGLSGAVQARLFEPFFTTKKTSGLGLGLAISQDIIRRFGGELTATNRPSGGARFRITLPLANTELRMERTNG